MSKSLSERTQTHFNRGRSPVPAKQINHFIHWLLIVTIQFRSFITFQSASSMLVPDTSCFISSSFPFFSPFAPSPSPLVTQSLCRFISPSLRLRFAQSPSLLVSQSPFKTKTVRQPLPSTSLPRPDRPVSSSLGRSVSPSPGRPVAQSLGRPVS